MAGEHHGPAGAALPTPTTARPEATKERRPMATRDQDTSAVITDDAPAGVQVREGEYGDRLIAVEPGGAEFIPLHERHGRPLQLFWTWTSPNLEFATVFVGVLAVAAFGLSFTQAVLAIVIGSGVGAITQGLLSARGPSHGVPQMVLSRLGFGYWGNVLPAGLNSITAGIGWFAVNSVSGAFALNTLTHMPKPLCLLIIVALQVLVAFFGHNLVHAFERYAFPLLAVIFVIATVVILAKAHPGAPSSGGGSGGFLLATGAAFGYAVGWNPYAADYSRYFKPDTSRVAIALWSGLGLFLSCAVLEVAGAGSATITSVGAALGDPTGSFTGHLPTAIADLTLLAIAIGAVAANVLNIYSGALSFVAMGVRLPLALRRAIVALVFGVIGFIVALTGLHDAGTKYENFLLIIAYWIAPWLAVVFCDQFLRRREPLAGIEVMLFDRRHTNWAGPVSMLAGMGLSIWLFSNQTEYHGVVPTHVPAVGDITFEVGFVITAVIYLTWHAITDRRPAAVPA
jgi:NCS1 nucleoside transporter family